MANFADLVRAQRESGKGVIGSLSGAYNQQNMQKFDIRNKLFSRSGLATALFPGLKGYQAQPISRKASNAIISPTLSNSPTQLNSIAKDARISARNSMALPSIARNMARMVKIWGGTPAKYFDSAAEKETAKEAKFGKGGKGGGVLGKSSGAGGGGIMGMLGGALGGIGSLLGSAVGGITNIAGSILGGIGSLLGGAASGIFGIVGSALGGMGFMGILAAGAIGFILYQIWKNLDFSKMRENLGIDGALNTISESLNGLVKEIDDMTGGRFSETLKFVKDTFKDASLKMIAVMKTGMEIMTKISSAAMKDFIGYIQNFYYENQGKILAAIAVGTMLGTMGPKALSLQGLALTALVGSVAGAVGSYFGENSVEKMQKDLDVVNQKIADREKTIADSEAKNPRSRARAFYAEELKSLNKEKANLEQQLKDKKSRTNNLQSALDEASSPGEIYERHLNEGRYNSTSQQFPINNSPKPVKRNSNISHQDAINYLMSKGNYTKEQAAGIVANLEAESGMNSLAVAPEEGSFGLAQWNPKSGRLEDLKKYAKSIGKSEKDPYVQLDFLMKELQDNPAYGDKDLRLATTAENAAMIFQTKYERPKNISSARASIATSLMGGNANQVAGAGSNNKPPPGAAPNAGGSSLLASLASPLEALNKYTGGALNLGSINVADMIRDLGNEIMDNPMLIDNSVNTVNGNDRVMATTATAWDQGILDTILNQKFG